MTQQPTSSDPTYRRWYDHDPLLGEVLEVLRAFEDQLKEQARHFLEKISAEVGSEAVEQFYANVLKERGDKFGRRWYDCDPDVSKAVELLRVVPPDAQRKAARSFLAGLKAQGVDLPESVLQRAELD